MSYSVRAQEVAVQTGASHEAVTLMRSKPELMKCLQASNIDPDIVEDVTDTCELNHIDALTIAAEVLTLEQIEELLFLTPAEAQVLVQNCKVVAYQNGVTFGAAKQPEPVAMKSTPVSSTHGNPVSAAPVVDKDEHNSDSLDFSQLEYASPARAAAVAKQDVKIPPPDGQDVDASDSIMAGQVWSESDRGGSGSLADKDRVSGDNNGVSSNSPPGMEATSKPVARPSSPPLAAAAEAPLDSPRFLPMCDEAMTGPVTAGGSAGNPFADPEAATSPRVIPESVNVPARRSTLSRRPAGAAPAGIASSPRSTTKQISAAEPQPRKRPASAQHTADGPQNVRTSATKRASSATSRSLDFDDHGVFLKYPGEMPTFMRPTVSHTMRATRGTAVSDAAAKPRRPAAAVPQIQAMSNLIRATAASAARAEATEAPKHAREVDHVENSKRGVKGSNVTVQIPFRLRTAQRPVNVELSSDELALKNAARAKAEEERLWNEKLKRAAKAAAARENSRGPTKFQPFKLTSLQLHERTVSETQKRLRKEREAERQARLFKAKPFDLQALAQQEAQRRSHKPPPAQKLTVPKAPSFLSESRIDYHHQVLEGKFRDTHEAFESMRKQKALAKQAETEAAAEAIRRQHKFVARSMPDFSAPFCPDPSKVAPVTKPVAPNLVTSARNHGLPTAASSQGDPISGASTPRLASPHGTSSAFAMSLRA